MRDLSALLLNASMDHCLTAIADLARADDLLPHETVLRLRQLSECARGASCPEVAFDPTAIRLRSIDLALRDRPEEREHWRARVQAEVRRVLEGTRALHDAA
jgi:hypothetical protein